MGYAFRNHLHRDDHCGFVVIHWSTRLEKKPSNLFVKVGGDSMDLPSGDVSGCAFLIWSLGHAPERQRPPTALCDGGG